VWGRSRLVILYAGVLGIGALLAIIWLGALSHEPSYVPMQAGTHQYLLAIADTDAAREKGLGDIPSLATNKGMLFVYPGQQELCFWMKDMRFPLDILWLDGGHRVVTIRKHVQPSSYPEQFCATAQYVIELNAGQVAAAHIIDGDVLNF